MTTDQKTYFDRTNTVLINEIEPGIEKNKLCYAIVAPVAGRLCPTLKETLEYLIHREVVREDDALKPLYEILGLDMEEATTRVHTFFPTEYQSSNFTMLSNYVEDLVDLLIDKCVDALQVSGDDEKKGYNAFMDEGINVCKFLAALATERAIRRNEAEACVLAASCMGLFSIVNLIASFHQMEGGFPPEAVNSFNAIWLHNYTNAIALQRKAIISTLKMQNDHQKMAMHVLANSETVH